MTASLSGVFSVQQFTDAGLPASGYRLYTYTSGTTTHKTAYTEPTGSTAHTYTSDGSGGQYIGLNSRGELPAPMYLATGSYDLCLKTSAGATVWTRRADPMSTDADSLRADLASTASGKGAAQVGFIAAGTGAVARTMQAKARESVTVTDYGAVAGGAGDIGLALQRAHDALGPDGGEIRIPAASNYYLQTTGAVFTKPIRLVGDGWYNSEIYSTVASLTWIVTSSRLDVENIHFSAYGAARGASTFIKVLAAATNHGHSVLRNNYFDGASRCYWSERTNAITVEGNLFGCIAGYSLYLENLTNPDEGDSFIAGNTFSCGDSGVSISVYVPSTAGISFTGNKFNTTVAGHVRIEHGAGDVGNYLFQGNSFEGHTVYAIKTFGTTGVNAKTVVSGNQFSSNSLVHIDLGQGAQNNVITGNVFSSTSAATTIGIIASTGSRNTTITGNAFHQILTAISTSAGQCLGITMSGNRFADDVPTMFVGDDGQSIYFPQRDISWGRLISNSSNAVYVDACKVIGYGTLEVKVYGLVQGVGVCNYHRRVLLSGSAVTDIDAAVSSGAAFDAQIANSGGYAVVGVKRNGATGTAVSVFVEVTARGQITDFKKA